MIRVEHAGSDAGAVTLDLLELCGVEAERVALAVAVLLGLDTSGTSWHLATVGSSSRRVIPGLQLVGIELDDGELFELVESGS